MPPLVSPWNDVWDRSAEIPYWWRVTTQIWVVLLIGWSKFPRGRTNREQNPDLGNDTSSVWNFCSRLSDVISRGNQWWLHEMSAIVSSYADRKAMKRRWNTNYAFCWELTESIFPVLWTARLRSHCDGKMPGTGLGTEVLLSFRSVK